MSIIATIFLFVLAMILAELEVQIEGRGGWAKDLPTWRPDQNKWYARWFSKIMSQKDLTGYHITMFSFVLFILHAHYFYGVTWSLVGELITLSYFFIFIVVWDFLWFVLNPYYALKKFDGLHIWWHKKWAGWLPVDYYGGLVISAILYGIASYIGDVFFLEWVVNFGLFAGLTIIVVLIYILITGDKVKDL